MGLLDKIKKLNLFAGFSAIDDEFYDELEEALILSDMGMDTTLKAVEELRERVRGEKLKDRDEVRACLRRVLQDMLNVGDTGLALDTRPAVVLFIGVNGVGKTTTIGKLAAGLKAQGKKVLLCAGDTFRAAAADQLTVWSQRAGVDIVKQHEGADPAAVVFDAVSAAKARGADVILVDTADSSRRASSSLPVTPVSRRFIRSTWLSVPPETSLLPLLRSQMCIRDRNKSF